MKKLLLVLSFLTLMPSMSWAAYQNPRIVAREVLPEGFVRLSFIFTGNAGEPDVRRTYVVNPLTTAAILRNWVDDTIQELDRLHTAATIPSLQLNQIVTRLARVAPVLTPKQIWNQKLERYLRIKDSGITAAASAIAALKTDLENTYQAGYLDE